MDLRYKDAKGMYTNILMMGLPFAQDTPIMILVVAKIGLQLIRNSCLEGPPQGTCYPQRFLGDFFPVHRKGKIIYQRTSPQLEDGGRREGGREGDTVVIQYSTRRIIVAITFSRGQTQTPCLQLYYMYHV